MKIVVEEQRTPQLIERLTEVWESSVRATHSFLSEGDISEITVNEQNPDAVGFYAHLGFITYRRADCDEQGRPFPLLYMHMKV
jgi:hypothetical protein